jgi:hypothetical protein
MKKTLTLLSIILITLISINAKAQDDKVKDEVDKEYVKSYVSIIAGVSKPVGNFGQYNYNNNSAGFAKPGATFGIDGAYYFYKNLAIGASFSFQDQGELTPNDAQILANGYNTDFLRDNTEITGVDRYHNISIMAGPQYSWIYHKFTIDVRASAGIIKSYSTPSVDIVFDESTNADLTLHQLSSNSSAFAYGASAGLRFNIGGKWDLGFKANYVNSDGIKIENSNNPGTTGRFVTKQPISVFQSTLGFTFHL